MRETEASDVGGVAGDGSFHWDETTQDLCLV